MSAVKEKVSSAATLFFYIIIVFEIIFMISPAALYYYSAYGPVLNVFRAVPGLEWLTAFFLPHFSASSFVLFNILKPIGFTLFFTGLAVFLECAVQIYYNKFTRRGAVSSGLYKYIRHPQYTAFMVMGFGTLMIWPRFFILISYLIMLILYFLLARKEEKECIRKYGAGYSAYMENTSMFLPGDRIIINKFNASFKTRFAKISAAILFFDIIIFISIAGAFLLRSYSITTLSLLPGKNSVSVSTASLNKEKISGLLRIAEGNLQVSAYLKSNNNLMLNYIVPAEWVLPDIPMDDFTTSIQGHKQPQNYDNNKYKILFTKAVIPDGHAGSYIDILTKTTRRVPLITVYVDYKQKRVTAMKFPPLNVLWGDIPTPLF